MSAANKDKTNEEQPSATDDRAHYSPKGRTPRVGAARLRFDKTFSANEKFSPSA